MQRNTTNVMNQEPDRNSLTFSIPRALIPIPILSEKERMIISRITSLSSKYSDKGGCNLPNEALAYHQECSTSTVSVAISKATWLGMLQFREDEIDKHPNKDGTTSITQRRRLKLVIPEIWTIFGEKWADFYFKGDKDAKQILDWMEDYVNKKYKEKTNSPSCRLNLLKMIKDAYLKFNRGSLENQVTPFINAKGSLFEDKALLMFTEVNVYGSKCLNTSSYDLGKTSPLNSSKENLPSNPPKKLNGKITPKQFDDFWALYPKREGGQGSKGKAKTKWDILCRSQNGNIPTWRQIKGAVIRQMKSEQWQNPKYIPMATTWLNNNRWLDDPKELQTFVPDNPKNKSHRGAAPIPGKYPDHDYVIGG